MSDATDQFLSHLGKWLCDLANDRPTECSRGWLRQLAEQHSYSALPWIRDAVEQIEREMLYLRKNERVTDSQTVVDLKIAIYDERQKHQAAIAQLHDALHKRQLVIDEATTEATKGFPNESQALSAEYHIHETRIRHLIEERDAANAALKALQVEHDAVLEDLHDAKERRAAALHYTDQLRSILSPNLEAWHDSDSVAEDFGHGSDEDSMPVEHCHTLAISANSPPGAGPTHDNGAHKPPPSLEQPNCLQQELHPLNHREQQYLQRIRDLKRENEELRAELQLSKQLHAVTDAELSDFPDEPPQGTEEVVKSPCQLDEEQRLQEGKFTAQGVITSDKSSGGSDREEVVEGGLGAWRAASMTEDLGRALHWLNDWHRSHFHVMH